MSQAGHKEVDGPNRPLDDDLLSRLVGNWRVAGKIMNRPIQQRAEVDWVLNHQFVRIHFADVMARDGSYSGPTWRYEALVFVGYDNMSERYVAHWLDNFGGRFSETLGFGTRQGKDSILFVFEYPDGPLHNTFAWHQESKAWTITMVQKDSDGTWTNFAEETLESDR
ncbi:MAG: DUF1579 family protein [Nitrososphaerales archaeon]